MKILMHNIYEGVVEAERFEKIVRFVKEQNPDVLGLLELNNWHNNKKLQEFLNLTGFKHHIFCKAKTGFNTCLFSKKPFTYSEIIQEGLWHGVIFAEIENIQFVLVHLSPGLEDERLKELEVIFSKIKKDKEVILMGDFNSLSSNDAYSPELIEKFKKIGLKKFGEDSLRFDVINKLKEKFIDVVRLKNKDFLMSVPTLFNKDIEHADKLRLDYFFVSPELARNIKFANNIINDETQHLSDHFPITMELDFVKRLRLGIDMDGVLINTNKLKIDYVLKHYNIIVDDSDVSKKKLSKIIGAEEYKKMIDELYSGPALSQSPPVINAKESMNDLTKIHDVIIITNRLDRELPAAKNWLKKNNIKYHSIINTSCTGKNRSCSDFKIDYLLDDNTKELEDVKGNTKKVLLMRPYNHDVDTENKYIHAKDWKDFLKIINAKLQP